MTITGVSPKDAHYLHNEVFIFVEFSFGHTPWSIK